METSAGSNPVLSAICSRIVRVYGFVLRIESCPFRHFLCYFLVDVDFGVGSGVDAEIAEDNHFVVGNHVGGM